MRRHYARHHVLLGLTTLLVFSSLVLAGLALYYTSSIPFSVTPSPAPFASSSASFLHDEEAVIIPSTEASSTIESILLIEPVLFDYVAITDSCGAHYQGECLNVRAGPGTEFAVIDQLRNGIVLKVGGKVERGTTTWYKIVFDEELRYPERVTSDWYIVADYVDILYDDGEKNAWTQTVGTTSKHIIVDTAKQRLTAYDGDSLFMDIAISTGLALTPTPKGTFTVFKKTPSRYMQGPLPGLPSDQYYDMPGVPWNLYFTYGGAVIHGTYWHDSFGSPYSHGCVNLPTDVARALYYWAPLGTTVTVK